MWAQKILASSKLRPYKLQVIPLAILGVVYYAMTRTGPKNWSKKKKNHENKQGDLPLEAAPSQPTSRLMSKTQKAIVTLLVLCGWLLCSVTLSTANNTPYTERSN